ncbi:ectonucleotide pyrophosphatase/phosphodiesterase [Dokdonia sp. R86516]|uniref:ectonucleotide pyrophosphatase/phosphodiesterase n=1 Tax=Dokdonia sp. R86516 TaxID=3093856 RepID=UPI0037CB13A8
MKHSALYKSLFLLVIFLALASCGSTSNVNNFSPLTTVNTAESLKKPYVILISLDGFRHDYVNTYNPPYLSSFIEEGSQAASLIPSFPTKTFPNHYTIATGMYPDNHGLLANSYYNYEKKKTYSIGNRETVVDGSFYKGTPLWVNANSEGMVTASYFFVGTEADIQGVHPTYYYNYDGKVTNQERVDQAIKWLEMPEQTRPHLITLYFSDMDDTGHRYGPNSKEKLKEALFKLDSTLGNLFSRVDNTGLPVNIVITSDHGMAEQSIEKLISTEPLINDALYNMIDNGVILNIHPHTSAETDKIFNKLKKLENKFTVYKTKDTPHFEYVPKNKNWGPIQIIPDDGYYFSSSKSIERRKAGNQEVFGVHGFTPALKDMHGILYAKGPAINAGGRLPSVKNIHVYPMICKILGLSVPSNVDGKLSHLKDMLRE